MTEHLTGGGTEAAKVDLEKIRRKYHRNVRFYDRVTARPTAALRRSAVARLRCGRAIACSISGAERG